MLHLKRTENERTSLNRNIWDDKYDKWTGMNGYMVMENKLEQSNIANLLDLLVKQPGDSSNHLNECVIKT